MYLHAVVSFALFIFQIHFGLDPSVAVAKCCLATGENMCYDGSDPTPCCGYGKCNGFCCACPGGKSWSLCCNDCAPCCSELTSSVVQLIREQVMKEDVTTWTSVMTAPPGTTWTCRHSHITSWDSAHRTKTSKRDVPEVAAMATVAQDSQDPNATTPSVKNEHPQSMITSLPLPFLYTRELLGDMELTFNDLSNGTEVNGTNIVSLEKYLGFFKVADSDKGSQYAQSVAEKFRMHDRDGDGVLTFDEIMRHCDQDGCE